MKGDPYGIDGLDTLVRNLNKFENTFHYENHRELEGIDFGRWDWCGDGITKDYEETYNQYKHTITGRQTGFTIHLVYHSKESEIGYIPRPWYNKTGDKITSLVVPQEKLLIKAPPFAMLQEKDIEPTWRTADTNRYNVYMRNGKYVVMKSGKGVKRYIQYGKYVNVGGDYAEQDPEASELFSRVGVRDNAPFPERKESPVKVTSVYDETKRHNKLFKNILYRFVLNRVPFMVFDLPMSYYIDYHGRTYLFEADYKNAVESQRLVYKSGDINANYNVSGDYMEEDYDN